MPCGSSRKVSSPNLLLVTEELDCGPVVGTTDDSQGGNQEDGLQGMVLSLKPMGIVDRGEQGHQGDGGGHSRHSRQGKDRPSYPQPSLAP